MRKRIVVVAALFLASCASNKTVVLESRAASPGPFKRLAVFVNLPINGDRGIYHGFRRALSSELESCNVESSIVQGMPPDQREVAVPDAAVTEAAAPDAQLIVRARDGLLRTVTYVNQFNQVVADSFKAMDLGLGVELLDHKQDRVTWLAYVNLHMEQSGPESGEQLAHTIVARLRSDGVLTRCR